MTKKTLKLAREKWLTTLKCSSVRLTADFSSEIMESTDSGCNDIFTVLKEMLSTKNSISSKNERKNRHSLIKGKKNLRKSIASRSALTKKYSRITNKRIKMVHMKFCLTQEKAVMEKWWNEDEHGVQLL